MIITLELLQKEMPANWKTIDGVFNKERFYYITAKGDITLQYSARFDFQLFEYMRLISESYDLEKAKKWYKEYFKLRVFK